MLWSKKIKVKKGLETKDVCLYPIYVKVGLCSKSYGFYDSDMCKIIFYQILKEYPQKIFWLLENFTFYATLLECEKFESSEHDSLKVATFLWEK